MPARKKIVGVLRGGKGPEYEISLLTGGNVLKSLPGHYEPIDILVTKNGAWHVGGVHTTPEAISRKVDVVFNALHGEYGEDGRVQHILDSVGVPYTGSRVFPSILAMNKNLSRERFLKHGIKIPRGVALHKSDNLGEVVSQVFNTMSPPWIVKPSNTGSSIGVSVCRSVSGLSGAINDALSLSDMAIVEEFIKGKEGTCCVVETGGGYRVLPSVEVKKDINNHFDYDSKYNGEVEEVCPGGFSDEEHWMMKNTAVSAHKALGMRHYSRSDFIVSPNRGVYLLEVNSLPGLTKESLIMKSLEASDTTFPDFLDHVVNLALLRK